MNTLLVAAAVLGSTIDLSFAGNAETVGPANEPPLTIPAQVDVIFSPSLMTAGVTLTTDDPQLPLVTFDLVEDIIQQAGERNFSSDDNRAQLTLGGPSVAGVMPSNFADVVDEVAFRWWAEDYPTFDANFTDHLALGPTSEYVFAIPEARSPALVLTAVVVGVWCARRRWTR